VANLAGKLVRLGILRRIRLISSAILAECELMSGRAQLPAFYNDDTDMSEGLKRSKIANVQSSWTRTAYMICSGGLIDFFLASGRVAKPEIQSQLKRLDRFTYCMEASR
jgi:hypothetical protein